MIKILLISCLLYSAEIKTVVEIESCAASMRCRVIFDDGTTDLLFNPYVGLKIKK